MKRHPLTRPIAAALVAATTTFAALAPAQAAPSPQLIAQIQRELPFYGINVDASKLSTATLALMYGILNSHDDYFSTRQQLRTALRNAGK